MNAVAFLHKELDKSAETGTQNEVMAGVSRLVEQLGRHLDIAPGRLEPIKATLLRGTERLVSGAKHLLVNFDLAPWNLIDSGEDVGIADWEHSRVSCLSLIEPLLFVICLGHTLSSCGALYGRKPHAVDIIGGRCDPRFWVLTQSFLVQCVGPLADDPRCLNTCVALALLLQATSASAIKQPPIMRQAQWYLHLIERILVPQGTLALSRYTRMRWNPTERKVGAATRELDSKLRSAEAEVSRLVPYEASIRYFMDKLPAWVVRAGKRFMLLLLGRRETRR